MKNNECCEVVIVGAAHTDLQLYPVGADVLDTASYSVKQVGTREKILYINILIKNTFSPYLGIMIFPLSSISAILFTFFVGSFFCLEKSFSNRIFSVCKVKGVVIDTKSAPASSIIYLS